MIKMYSDCKADINLIYFIHIPITKNLPLLQLGCLQLETRKDKEMIAANQEVNLQGVMTTDENLVVSEGLETMTAYIG